jgi:Ca-activated chloride channel homolog
MQPTLELIPLRSGLCHQVTTTLDLLVRITPPPLGSAPDQQKDDRRDLNIALVLDRSGSMSEGQKMPYAIAAAAYVVEQLSAGDRVSVIAFDHHVDTPVPSTFALNKAKIIQKIKALRPGGSTALHAGWMEGGMQVSQHLNSAHLNRVLVLSDGHANVGETNPDVIGRDVAAIAQKGISTTTLGVGDDYDETFLEAMAASGDGSYYYIEKPEQLPEIFDAELQGLLATLGRKVTLKLTPGAGVKILDCFNDFSTLDPGTYSLPNLIADSPFVAAFRLEILAEVAQDPLLQVELAWDEADTPQRQHLRQTLALPWVSREALEALPFNEAVQEEVAVLMVARAKKEASAQVRQGNYEAAKSYLTMAAQTLGAVPASPAAMMEVEALDSLAADLEDQNFNAFSKRSHYESHMRSRGSAQKNYAQYQTQRKGGSGTSPRVSPTPPPNPQPPSPAPGSSGGQSSGQSGDSAQGKSSGQSLGRALVDRLPSFLRPGGASQGSPSQGSPAQSSPSQASPAQGSPSQNLDSPIQVVRGDITKIPVDAIANAANTLLAQGSGVNGAIHQAAGPGLRAECRQVAPCGVGEAVVTNAYGLPARWVIHTVGPKWQGGHQGEEEVLGRCYDRCLSLALERGAQTVSFPAIATGAFGCPLPWAAAVAVRSVRRFLSNHPNSDLRVILVCWDQAAQDAYEAALASV